MEQDANRDKRERDFQENLVIDNQEHVISVNNGTEQDYLSFSPEEQARNCQRIRLAHAWS